MTLLVDRCVTHAGAEARRRGWEQVTEGRVDLRSVAGRIARIEARDGARIHRVEIDWRDLADNRLGVHCTCADFSRGVCSHLWASLLTLDARDVRVPGDGPLTLVPRTGTRPQSHAPTPASAWRRQLDDIVQRAPTLGPTAAGWRQVWLILDPAASREQGAVKLDFYCRDRLQAGGWGKLKPVTVDPDRGLDAFGSSDRRLIERLLSFVERDDAWPSGRRLRVRGVVLPTALLGWLLPPLCASERFGWLEDGADRRCRPIVWDAGAVWHLALVGKPVDGDILRLDGLLRRGDADAADAMALDRIELAIGDFVFTHDRVARFRGTEAAWLPTLRAGTIDVPAADIGDALDAMARLRELPELDLPTLDSWSVADESAPIPRLSVGFEPRATELLATVDFAYTTTDGSDDTDVLVRADDPRAVVLDAEHRRLVRRDRTAERRCLDALGPEAATTDGADVRVPTRRFVTLANRLIADGWRLLAAGRPMRGGGRLRAQVHHRVDWLELEGGVDFVGPDDVAVRFELPALLHAVRRGETLVELGDGSVAMLPEEWLQQLAPWAALAPESTQDADAVRFEANQALLLDALLADDEAVRGTASFNRLTARLHDVDRIEPIDQPDGFHGTLREYQRQGLGRLVWWLEVGLGGCLADDMGLGKTIQVLALLVRRHQSREHGGRPSLLVVPRSLLHNWRQEAERFVPSLDVMLYHGAGRDRLLDTLGDRIVVTTYGTMRQDVVALRAIPFDLVVLDEAQAIKNADSQTAKAARLLNGRHRLALTGTPVENHLGELWSLFAFLDPGMLDPRALGGLPDDAVTDTLARALRPLILRRTKEQVLPDLPAKTEQTIACDLGDDQRRDYDALRDHYRAAIGDRVERLGLGRSKLQVLEALLRLRQAACHPGLIDPRREAESSAKLEVLLDRLSELAEEGHKALVFSQFTRFLGIVRRRLDTLGLPYAYLDGKTRDRQEGVERFQNDPDCPVFLISLKAGGTGLNLTAASYVFLLDPWWNPAVEAQAIDRSHRIGQERPVFAYRLIARNTVEEKILELQASKRALADAIVARDDRVVRDLTADDLALLLG
ncbi:MAG: DEAD/DEAH box helicase [Acidobacteriota bacterium]